MVCWPAPPAAGAAAAEGGCWWDEGFAAACAGVHWLRWSRSGAAGGVPPPLERALIVGVITLSFAFFVSIRCAVVPPRKGTPQVGHTQQIVGLVYL